MSPNLYAKGIKNRNRARAYATRARVELSAAGRDIGDIPPVANSSRKKKALRSFKLFCDSYFPKRFTLAWSPDHLQVIELIERTVMHGEKFAVAMARGSGKTSLCEAAVIWAVLVGLHHVVVLIAASEDHAGSILANIKAELVHNELLMQDFPEVCHPLKELEGEARRTYGQLHHGIHTHIEWSSDRLRLPMIPGSVASSNIIRVAGITGAIRGMSFTRPDGRKVRPSLCIIDDPQTDESAKSLSQCVAREAIIGGAINGLGGPGEKVAIIMPCTVIRKGDVADTFINRVKYPEWNGVKMKMLPSFPSNQNLWQKYWDLRSASLIAGGDVSEANTFYAKHQVDMDAGAVAAWEERKNVDELSAIQHAMNLYFANPSAFMSEYQNDPLEDIVVSDTLTVDELAQKIEGTARGTVPLRCTHLTAFIDIQKELLPYVVTAWDDTFGGTVIDYGTWPDQLRAYFKAKDAGITLSTTFPQQGTEGRLHSGLAALCTAMLGREYQREDGSYMKVERCLIDANWGESTDIVYDFTRNNQWPTMPAHGRFVGASSKPFHEWHKTAGDRIGLNWRIPKVSGRRMVRHVLYDTNYWKSFVHARFCVARGDPGCLTIFGREPRDHRLIAEHLTAEFKVRTEGRGRVVDEWKIRPDTTENHWFDCLVGCAVAASMLGLKVSIPTASSNSKLTKIGTGRKRLTAQELSRAYAK